MQVAKKLPVLSDAEQWTCGDAGYLSWEAHCGHAILWGPAIQCRQGGGQGEQLL